MIHIKVGDIFESQMEVLVNTINCVGVMGKGLAQIFKMKYPEMFIEYKEMCKRKIVHTGCLYPYSINNQVKVLNFPTKEHWRSPSRVEYIETGLSWFIDNYKVLHIKSIAFPPLGCGNGGMEWENIGPLMYEKLKDLPIDIEIYAPYGTPMEQLRIEFLSKRNNISSQQGIVYGKINDNWLLILQLIKKLGESKYSVKVGRTIFQKICYVLSRYGTDLGIQFQKGTYGPYSDDIKKMITILANNNLIYEKEHGKMILIQVSQQFKINRSLYASQDIENVNKTFHLFKRIKDSIQAELVTSILFSFDILKENNQDVTEDMVYQYIVDWKKRYDDEDSEVRIRELTKSLTGMKLIDTDYSKGYKEDSIFS